jgi:hypothetical protein
MTTPHAALFETLAASGPSRADSLARIEALAHLMDTALVIPGTRIRFGLDAVIGLVPGIGDLVSAVVSSYIVWEARRLGLPRWKIGRMMANVALDTAVGAVPFVGDVLDVFYKANRRNLRIIQDHFRAEPQPGVIDAEYRVVGGPR